MSDERTVYSADKTDGVDLLKGDLTGAVINNNYRVGALISQGGMGEVYRGEQVFTGDPVAIKIVLPSLAQDEKVLALFKREARILSQLADDAIVRYFNFLHDAALDRYCLIMDFIDGVPLSEYVAKQSPLDEASARRLMARLAAGLDKAHQREVTHRDLSPDNVMMVGSDVDQAVLIDFGIARSTEMQEGTLHGQFAGKFKYISPEQLGHFEGVIGPRTDVYGLGLLIAAAVRGRPLEMGTSVVEAVNARRQIPDLTDVPARLVPLLSHMLEPDPAHRPARMTDVVRMVEAPDAVPAVYRTALPDAHDRTVFAGDLPRIATAPPQTGTAFEDSSLSPFGGHATGAITAPDLPASQAGSKRSLYLGLAVVLAMIGTVGVYWQMQQASVDVAAPAPEALQTPLPEMAQMPPPDTKTRAGFLAAYGSGARCSSANRITAGADAGKLETLAPQNVALGGLSEAYADAFGAKPEVISREITQAQCAAVELVRGLQGRSALPPVVTLDTDAIASGGSVVGRIRDLRGRVAWLALVSASGGVYNLSSRLEPQADGSTVFQFGLEIDPGSDPAPQLVLVVVSEAPLVSLATLSDGSDAAEVLPRVMDEIARNGGTAAADLGYVMLGSAG